MLIPPAATLVNPQNGNLAFKLYSFGDNSYFDHIQRLNYYSLIWIQKGAGKLKTGFSEYGFESDNLLAFAPYQPFMLQTGELIEGTVIHFHPEFFCIHKHQQEIACNGLLFNNIYKPPFVAVDGEEKFTFNLLISQIRREMQSAEFGQYELLILYLKIFLITASRLKVRQQPEAEKVVADNKEPFILQDLKNYIEQYFKTKHTASDYAELLHITPKALAKITKTHFNKTLTDLISERIMIEAKRELYLSPKPVKQIAYELGYDDEYYFSRFFKNNADVSPKLYRETVGFAKGAA